MPHAPHRGTISRPLQIRAEARVLGRLLLGGGSIGANLGNLSILLSGRARDTDGSRQFGEESKAGERKQRVDDFYDRARPSWPPVAHAINKHGMQVPLPARPTTRGGCKDAWLSASGSQHSCSHLPLSAWPPPVISEAAMSGTIVSRNGRPSEGYTLRSRPMILVVAEV